MKKNGHINYELQQVSMFCEMNAPVKRENYEKQKNSNPTNKKY